MRFSEKRGKIVLQVPAAWWLSLASLYIFVAVYRWDFIELRRAKDSLALVLIALVACALGILQSSRDPDQNEQHTDNRRLLIGILVAAIATHTLVAIWIIRHYPGKVIDVFTVQTTGVEAFLKGIDPYTITQANIYGPRETAQFYPPGIFVNSRLQFGFSYPPLVLLFAIPGYLLGDIRYSHIAAIALSAILMARMRTNWTTTVVTCLFLLNPLTFLVERYSWTDAFIVLPLCATVYAAVKRRWWLPIAFGLFLVSKQYAILGLPFVLLLCDFDWKRSLKLLGQALAVAAIVTVPFALWDVRHFVHDTIIFIVQSPARIDSLSFAARHPIPFFAIMAAVAVATVWALCVTKRHPSMFAACFGLVLLVFVCTNKQAFSNYYFLVAQALWLAVVAMGVPDQSAVPDATSASDVDAEESMSLALTR